MGRKRTSLFICRVLYVLFDINKSKARHWQIPVIPATQKAEAEELLEPRCSRPDWVTKKDPTLKEHVSFYVHINIHR
jgi:hypothetical protein